MNSVNLAHFQALQDQAAPIPATSIWIASPSVHSEALAGKNGTSRVPAGPEVECTNFPLPEIRFFLADQVFLQPSVH